MLPSAALFSQLDCPLRQRGRCDRPFCQYRHGQDAAEPPPSAQGFTKPIASVLNGGQSSKGEKDSCYLELERINKQIETVKCEVEKEQKKLSRYHTAQVDSVPTYSDKYQSKYSINKAGKDFNSKYVLDLSRPRTDLEYDPYSNFSADLRCSNQPKSDKAHQECETTLEPGVKKTEDNSCGPLIAPLHESEDSDDGALIIDIPSLEEDPKCVKPSKQCKVTLTCESKNHVPRETRCRTVSSKLVPSKDAVKVSGGKSTQKKLTSSALENSKNLTLCNSKITVAQSQKKETEITTSAEKVPEKVPSPKRAADLPTRPLLMSSQQIDESHGSIETVVDDIAVCLDNMRNESERISCMNRADPAVMNSDDLVADWNVKAGFLSAHQELSSGDTELPTVVSFEKADPSGQAQPTVHSSTTPARLSALMGNNQVGLQGGCLGPMHLHPSQNVPVAELGQNLQSPSTTQVSGAVCLSAGQLENAASFTQCPTLSAPLSADPCVEHCGQDPTVTKPELPENQADSSSENELRYSDLELSETDPMEECYNIFMEANKDEDPSLQDAPMVDLDSVEEQSTSTVGTETKSNLVNAQKKRVAHVAKFEGASSKPKAQVIIPYRGGASQLPSVLPRGQLCQRPASLVTAVEKLYQTANMNRKPPLSAPQAAPIKNACVKIIPTVQLAPNVHFILPEGTCAVPVTLLPGPVTLPQPPQLTPAKPLPIKRKAKVKPDVGAKVPHDVRQRYVNLFVEEFLKTSATVQEAFEKALVEEKVVYDRSINRLKYLSVAVNSLKRLKSQSSLPVKAGADKSVQRSKGKIALDSGALHGAGDSSLYESLKEHVLSEEMLKENSYPMKHPHKAGCAIQYGDVKKSGPDSLKRICCRCGATFSVSQTGKHTRKEECNYHYGRVVEKKVPGGVESHYSCCEGAVGTPGCHIFKLHVHDAVDLSGFVSSQPLSPAERCCPGVYAMDCEMCYTTRGLELARVTVVNSSLRVIYDAFVRPDCEVVDYNTRFTGVSEEDVKGASANLHEVQATLLSFINKDTILIGHSLESDLCALKLLHSTVVDTSVVFPHRLGLPHKRALHSLTADYLRRIIQESAEDHDTGDDAAACMELILWRVKEDSKIRRF
ncbi:RNA exonuclease 1 homolog isoform X2 [Denticeps clupeoides]|uniref:RNA exonuclease 1 homolog isoform X2 n=1 Tax=Denticeps clupeoides TaxID=299321 RepID=UPI0010A3C500|nr:RNA exonuclease 1 homolog isoform X2 [Denticeps clupeoides]